MPMAFATSKLFPVSCQLGDVQPEAGGCYREAQIQDASPFIS